MPVRVESRVSCAHPVLRCIGCCWADLHHVQLVFELGWAVDDGRHAAAEAVRDEAEESAGERHEATAGTARTGQLVAQLLQYRVTLLTHTRTATYRTPEEVRARMVRFMCRFEQ